MNCPNCGAPVNDYSQFCTNCGARMQQNMPVEPVKFMDAVKLYFTRYADFKGRSRRSEYWWACLAMAIISGIISAIIPDLAGIWSLATLIPGIAICVRRLHDIGKSGWYYLIGLIPLVGGIILIVWFCKDSTPDNQWGPNPKGYRGY